MTFFLGLPFEVNKFKLLNAKKEETKEDQTMFDDTDKQTAYEEALAWANGFAGSASELEQAEDWASSSYQGFIGGLDPLEQAYAWVNGVLTTNIATGTVLTEDTTEEDEDTTVNLA